MQTGVRSLLYLSVVLCASLFVYRHFIGRMTTSSVYTTNDVGERPGTQTKHGKDEAFAQALRERADDKGIIILASVDSGYIDMALNFYETSLKKLKLNNYLFVTSDLNASRSLSEHGIANFNYFNDKDAKKSSKYDSAAFARKTHYKTKIILEALKLGLTVLISDVDIILFKDPIPFMTCSDCDIQITIEKRVENSGFYLVRPTPGGILLHEKAWNNALSNPSVSNQKQLHRVSASLRADHRLKSLSLSSKEFPCGTIYFEQGHRMFAGDNPCQECVIMHDNWIVGGDAKIYRLKEHLMWRVDGDGYYSDSSRKYIAYDNPLDFEGQSVAHVHEAKALKSAMSIGHILNRTVILPTFCCVGCQFEICKNPRKRCALNANYNVATFNKAFGGAYREHVFLQHDLVPDEVKQSRSGLMVIDSKVTADHLKSESDLVHFTPADISRGPSPAEILTWFNTEEYSHISVLRFHSLYDSFSQVIDEQFDRKLAGCLKKSTYRQYK